jgi:hypothetical protein
MNTSPGLACRGFFFGCYAANLAYPLIQLSMLSASHRLGARALPSFTGCGN